MTTAIDTAKMTSDVAANVAAMLTDDVRAARELASIVADDGHVVHVGATAVVLVFGKPGVLLQVAVESAVRAAGLSGHWSKDFGARTFVFDLDVSWSYAAEVFLAEELTRRGWPASVFHKAV